MIALELTTVSKARGRAAHLVRAVRGVSLTVASGEVVLVEGPSGAGKTTLLMLGAGLLTPDAGTVMLAGERLGALSPSARGALRARVAGFVFQRSNLLEGLTVRENVLLAAALAGLDRNRAADHADRLLARLGLAALARRHPATLSGGEEHRVAVARALVHGPAVVFADEPTGSLDSVSGQAVAEVLSVLAREHGAAVVVASHDARLRRFATRRFRMSDGELSAVTGG